MPRRVAESCFFCGQAPCVCNAKPKKNKPRSKPVKTVDAPILADPTPAVKRTFKSRDDVHEMNVDLAIRNLAPILHPDEIEAHADILCPGGDARARVANWRRRNGLVE